MDSETRFKSLKNILEEVREANAIPKALVERVRKVFAEIEIFMSEVGRVNIVPMKSIILSP